MKNLTNQKKKEVLCLIGAEGGDPMEIFQKSSITDPIEFGRYVDWLIDNRFICFEEHCLIWSGFSSMDALQEVIKDQKKENRRFWIPVSISAVALIFSILAFFSSWWFYIHSCGS
ncbi:MAG: hypothetical protein HFG27_08385 [Provencibacterium sp.]|jgi:hypothetical protein|nr:hypothetical protein [Provencibacterium sp.]